MNTERITKENLFNHKNYYIALDSNTSYATQKWESITHNYYLMNINKARLFWDSILALKKWTKRQLSLKRNIQIVKLLTTHVTSLEFFSQKNVYLILSMYFQRIRVRSFFWYIHWLKELKYLWARFRQCENTILILILNNPIIFGLVFKKNMTPFL